MAVLSLPLYAQRILPAINTLVVSLLAKSSAPQDMEHRMHRHQRTKFKSTVVGCGEKEHTERHRMCDLHHSRAGGGFMKRQAFSLVSLLSLLLVAGSAI